MGEHDWKSEVWNVFNSTADAPVKFTITRNGATLYAQVGTQSAVPLEATAEDKFKIDNGTATGHRF